MKMIRLNTAILELLKSTGYRHLAKGKDLDMGLGYSAFLYTPQKEKPANNYEYKDIDDPIVAAIASGAAAPADAVINIPEELENSDIWQQYISKVKPQYID